MKEQLINFETAKLAKEKGVKLDINGLYWEDGSYDSGENALVYEEFQDVMSAPTQSLLQKWLREFHNIIVTSKPYQDDVSNETDEDIEFQTLWENEIVNVKDSYNTFSDNTFHHSYEEALEVGLQEALKLI